MNRQGMRTNLRKPETKPPLKLVKNSPKEADVDINVVPLTDKDIMAISEVEKELSNDECLDIAGGELRKLISKYGSTRNMSEASLVSHIVRAGVKWGVRAACENLNAKISEREKTNRRLYSSE